MFVALGALPIDNIKTKLIVQKANKDGRMPFSGIIDCFFKTVKLEGPLALWAGFPAYFLRVAPHTCITLMVLEALRSRFM